MSQDARISPKASYAVQVRIKIRAGKTVVAREGTGLGHGIGATLGEAHESALKEAETDATTRALVTFGNPFGVALYDKAQAGVQRTRALDQELSAAPVVWTLMTGTAPPQICATPQHFCSAAKENFHHATSIAELKALWTGNAPVIAQLRTICPELRTRNGVHYAAVLENFYRQQRTLIEPEPRETKVSSEVYPPESTAVAIVIPRRLRNAAHLKYVASLPCLVCGQNPSHAHHPRFIQPRSLHDAGREEQWWQINGMDATAGAESFGLRRASSQNRSHRLPQLHRAHRNRRETSQTLQSQKRKRR
ncbi:MAG TPA: Rad52/Rad22 family DNA repair protein [Stellaceae bacterium]|nr:Rad52/Rad22 family DNA repair protein [Stellaceae bacterium]